MNKIFLGIVILAAVAVGWFILNPGDTFDYVVTVDSEITELENELADIEVQVAAGTLTEEQATAAKVRIITRLDAINTAADQSERAQLTPAQRTQLMEGLERLKVILVTYQGTLATVEASADETEVRAELNRRGGSYTRSKPLNVVVADTISDVEETVQDSVQDYESNVELDAQIETIVEEAEIAAEDETQTEVETETETTSEESTEEEVATDESTDTNTEEEVTDEEPMVGVDVSADAELETTTN